MRASQLRNTKQMLFILLTILCFVGSIRANFIFGKPVSLGPVINSASSDYGACVSADGVELYFASERAGGLGAADIWVSKRQSVNDPWDSPTNLGSTVNCLYSDSYPSLSSDGLTLYFSDVYSGSPRPGGLGGGDIWKTTRSSRNAAWGTPVNLGSPINSSALDMSPTISGDGLTLIFTSNNRSGGRGSWDIWISTRASVQNPWDPPVNLGPAVNSGDWEGECSLSSDGRAVFFGSGRVGIAGAIDLWMSTRKTLGDQWSAAINLGPVINSSSNDGTARVSSDMRTLYFCSDRPDGFGSYDLMEAPIIPVVDLNGDGIVDAADMCILVDHWGTDNPLCDIGPAPWGDGIIDVQDMIVLSEHLFEDYRMVAQWKLDEEVGNTAHDSAGNYDGDLNGGPIWQPAGGLYNGALGFDGNDDYISTPFILNPGQKSFSVFAWIQGGSPGQVIISQSNTSGGRGVLPGCTWLGTNPSDGSLMTGLMDTFFGSLESNSIITDGQWRHIGLVFDRVTMRRHLYIDGAEIAADTDFISGVQTTGGLYIGAGQALDATSFFSGLIDDVRIYDIALTAEDIAALAQ